MQTPDSRPSRRLFLTAAGAALFTTRGLYAEQLFATPPLTEGPFYPDKLPLDTDSDLLIINDHITPAVGEVTHLTGRVLGPSGTPLRNVTLEIWQCDAHEVYLHTGDSETTRNAQDKNFQGFGRFTTGSTGEYRFRTIKPIPYPGRPAPHIHFKLKRGDRELLTTQLMIRGHPGNARDGIFSQAGDLIDRELIQVDFVPLNGNQKGEWSANFDIILGRTPDDRALESGGLRRNRASS